MKKLIFKIFLAVFGVGFVICGVLALLVYQGIIWFVNPSEKEYPVRGVDVSVYQGEINWDILASQNIDFAFIKATEGSDFVDEKFTQNWNDSQKTSLKIGAYHFFSFDSEGKTQADNFIRTVPKFNGMLSPVIDLEFYKNHEKKPPAAEKVKQELEIFIDEIKKIYGVNPIIYVMTSTYDLYIKNDFADCPIWYRSITKKPILSDGRSWDFWQYSPRGRLKGYEGQEKYIDLNVFSGNEENFEKMFGKNK